MIPRSVKREVWIRAEGRCEWVEDGVRCNSTNMLDWCHVIHRKMGGRKGVWKKLINHKDNIRLWCRDHHDIWDGRSK